MLALGPCGCKGWLVRWGVELADDHLLLVVDVDNGAVAFADPAGEEFLG